jgi:hypothetical protein
MNSGLGGERTTTDGVSSKMTISQLLWMLVPFVFWVVACVALTRTSSRLRRGAAILAGVTCILGQAYLLIAALQLHGWVGCRGDWSCESELDRCKCSNLRFYAGLGLLVLECATAAGLTVARRSGLKAAPRTQ